MKVLMINGSPRKNSNTGIALAEMEKVFHKNGIETIVMQIGAMDIRGCMGCGYCFKNGRCAMDDIVNETAQKLKEADGVVIGSPVYYAAANGTLVSFLDRLFYSTQFSKCMKVGASVAVARRGGCTATFDQLNKYFTISGMPVASSQYWNAVHGRRVGEAAEDAEGLQTMRFLAENMSFLIKCIALGREQFEIPEREPWTPTHFIRK